MPVSTAAVRTSSTTAPISTRSSRLPEYSMVKCGTGGSLPNFLVADLREVTAHRAMWSVVGLYRVALARLDRADERSRQHDLPGLEGKSVRRDLVGEPRHRRGRMVEHAGGKARLFQLAVTIAQRADPAQVGIERADRPAAEHDAGIGRIVGDGVENLARRPGLRVDPLDPRVENLQRRHHEVGRVEH
ncbi:hypothetical protein KXV85_004324, partial [Aspergillus fumigatus]